PTDEELERQAEAVGGEQVLAAILANALFGAAIGIGMLAEGHMLEAGGGSEELTLAREQVLKASGATGPGVIGIMHWQAGQIAGPWRGWSRSRDLGPMGGAAAATAWALTLILQACTVTDLDDARFDQLSKLIAEARDHLAAAQGHLQGINDAAVGLAADLFPEFDW
ncbi:MAG: DUF6245 family protein, partial [Candidatus Dormibacteria bacterium]